MPDGSMAEYLETINDPNFIAAAYSLVTGVDTDTAMEWLTGVCKVWDENDVRFWSFTVDSDEPCAVMTYRTQGMPDGMIHQMRLGPDRADWDRWAMSPADPDSMRIDDGPGSMPN